jgi:hypothetical protein
MSAIRLNTLTDDACTSSTTTIHLYQIGTFMAFLLCKTQQRVPDLAI